MRLSAADLNARCFAKVAALVTISLLDASCASKQHVHYRLCNLTHRSVDITWLGKRSRISTGSTSQWTNPTISRYPALRAAFESPSSQFSAAGVTPTIFTFVLKLQAGVETYHTFFQYTLTQALRLSKRFFVNTMAAVMLGVNL